VRDFLDRPQLWVTAELPILSLVGELIEKVKSEHPYQVPEVITIPLDNGNPAYLKWLDESIK